MVFSHLLANESIVGVDIGSKGIKIIRAEPSKHGARITHVATCDTPPDCVKEGVIVNVPEVAAAIKTCMRSAGIKASSAIAAISGPGVIVRQVQIPTMPEKVLRRSIRFEASKYISSNIDESVVEFEILGPSQEEGQMNVMLAAAPTAMVESRVTALEQAGLEPLSIDVEVFATLRSLIDYNPDRFLLESTVALLDIGASHSEINLVCKGSLELSRTIPIAGDGLTNAIKNGKTCEDVEAEAFKLELDMTELVGTPAGSTSSPSLRGVQSLIDELLREIRRSVNYYQSQLPEGAMDTNVETLILSGGTARLKGLGPYIHSRLNMEVRTGNPALVDILGHSIEGGLSEDDVPLYTVAFGLAVKELSQAVGRGLSAA